jgi:hypothetical protein
MSPDLHCVRHPVTTGLHDDHTPSLQLYPDASWCCFAPHGNQGRIGGTIYDFAARLWGNDTRGPQFPQLRARLAAQLLGERALENELR